MSIREQFANGNFNDEKLRLLSEPVEWDAPEDNSFVLKSKDRAHRMLKSATARTRRHMLRDIKQERYQLGFNGNLAA